MSGFLDHLSAFAKRAPDDHCCPECGENIDAGDVSVEAFEWAGKIICVKCFEAGVEQEAEDNSQFGMGA